MSEAEHDNPYGVMFEVQLADRIENCPEFIRHEFYRFQNRHNGVGLVSLADGFMVALGHQVPEVVVEAAASATNYAWTGSSDDVFHAWAIALGESFNWELILKSVREDSPTAFPVTLVNMEK